MIVIAFAIFGALLGYGAARRRQGNGKDKAQYAIAYGLVFIVAGVLLTVLIDRLAG